MKYSMELNLETVKNLFDSIEKSVTENNAEKTKSILTLMEILNTSIVENVSKTVLEDIDMLKDFVIDLQEITMHSEKNLNDFCFNIEVDYQNWYDLDEDNWEKVEK